MGRPSGVGETGMCPDDSSRCSGTEEETDTKAILVLCVFVCTYVCMYCTPTCEAQHSPPLADCGSRRQFYSDLFISLFAELYVCTV
jgi:hypothetical protein